MRFIPTVNDLEPRQLLSVTAPPHQIGRNLHTGNVLGGIVTLEAVDATTNGIDVSSTTYTGTGTVNIAGRRVQATITITIGEDQSFSLFISDDQGDSISASGLSLADESAGNYRINEATGAWAAVHGTGTWRLNADEDGSAVFALNPHQ